MLPSVAAAEAVIVPGVPSARVPEREQAIYPASAPDIRKMLLDAGVNVAWADERSRAYLDLKANEQWLPVIVFMQEALANGLGGVLTAAFPASGVQPLPPAVRGRAGGRARRADCLLSIDR